MKLSKAGAPLALAEFAAWYGAQMRSLLPFLRQTRPRDALTVQIAEPAILWLTQGGKRTRLGELRQQPDVPANLPVLLELPPGSVLTREVVLPLAVARQLQSVMRFEMDRLTPFPAEALYWGLSGITPDRPAGKLRLQLAFVPRAPVDEICRQLAQHRLFPHFIVSPGGRIPLDSRDKPRNLAALALPALCAVLALACLLTPFLRQQQALAAASQSIAQAMPAAQTALSLRRQLTTAMLGRAAIAQAQQAGDPLHVLANLTNALPDDTFIGDLTLKSGQLTLDGQSADAAALIGRIAAAPGFRDPSFTAPVTRTADGKADQFSLQASLAP